MNIINDKNNKNFILNIIKKDIKKDNNLFIRTRFPPEPNGYLHIGHAKSICLNFELANIYKGTCNLRFDDTNPLKENIKYINSIKRDIKWLGYQWNEKTHYTSEYFSILYQYAKVLIDKGLAYVDELTKDQIRQYRGTLTKPGINSPYRNRTIQKNMELFKKMKNGDFPAGKACLRAKIDMNSANIVMRDPVLYRIIFDKHHQKKNKWCIYPMYDFAHCLSDSIENITHSLCTLEFQDNKHLYNWILKNLDIKKCPQQYEFSRLNLEYSLLSKRKLNILINKKIVQDWNDPRLLTISGLRRKGYTASSIRKFCKNVGVTKQNHLIQFSMLEYCIRKELNQTAIRIMAVLDPIKVSLYNLHSHHEEIFTIPNHPHRPELGTHEIIFTNTIYIERSDFQERYDKKYKRLKLGKKIRLRYAYIIKAEKIEKDNYGNIINIICYCYKNTLGKKLDNEKNPSVIHWIAIKNTYPSEFRLYDQLFTVKNPEQKKEFLSYINPKSLIIKHGFIEKNIANEIQKNIHDQNHISFFQFERIGYFCIDTMSTTKNYLVFNRTVNLRDNLKQKI
ncbi:MAG: glutamine--tRNA ligase [Buchnera aphidicola (Pentalonia nigronervosa)]|jgi:glutaminyl-tRNA synthetase|uniref:Glutamine--tRNA ligase n=1 Tax=Buchnera aphidicola (Pentalonia nigronervosa) TaxID=1309793 RepID=A0A7H1B021_9GAMM|nr:MAG: glutamine--tRNA ligase [Buchnera aphidicola (Pentalonia nigronervosa)]